MPTPKPDSINRQLIAAAFLAGFTVEWDNNIVSIRTPERLHHAFVYDSDERPHRWRVSSPNRTRAAHLRFRETGIHEWVTRKRHPKDAYKELQDHIERLQPDDTTVDTCGCCDVPIPARAQATYAPNGWCAGCAENLTLAVEWERHRPITQLQNMHDMCAARDHGVPHYGTREPWRYSAAEAYFEGLEYYRYLQPYLSPHGYDVVAGGDGSSFAPDGGFYAVGVISHRTGEYVRVLYDPYDRIGFEVLQPDGSTRTQSHRPAMHEILDTITAVCRSSNH